MGGMDISNLLLKVLWILTPGIISSIILDEAVHLKDRSPFRFFIRSWILGAFNYMVFSIIASYGIWELNSLDFRDLLLEKQTVENLRLKEMGTLVLISVGLGFFSSFLITKKALFWILHKFSITNKFGDNDVWSFIHNSKENTGWIILRDHNLNLYYQGWVQAFSESHEENEILLRNVEVFKNDTGELIYSVPGMYIARNKSDLTLEFPVLTSGKKDKKND
jgi:Family of unknown function (DUF6338)